VTPRIVYAKKKDTRNRRVPFFYIFRLSLILFGDKERRTHFTRNVITRVDFKSRLYSIELEILESETQLHCLTFISLEEDAEMSSTMIS